jgi:cyclic 2,3-diphosphoglycerate synthase
MRSAVVLVDGEHHPPVVRRALSGLADEGTQPVLAVVLGGGEKLGAPGEPPELGVRAVWPPSGEDALARILAEESPDVVLDLSGEPIVSARRRLRLAAIVLAAGVPYEAPGLRYEVPDLTPRSRRPAVSVVATGKRTGKTAMSGALARRAMRTGRTPAIVAMGRGGPPEPTVVAAGSNLGPDDLLEVAEEGLHAASDFYEDAVMTNAATIGCYRVGDGPAGMVATSNVVEGIAAAEEVEADITILEGSGAAIPPCAPDALCMVVPAHLSREDLGAIMPLGFLLADLVLITFSDTPSLSGGQLADLLASVRSLTGSLPRSEPPTIALTTFRPHPLVDVAGRRVFLATTAPLSAGQQMARALEQRFGAYVVGVSHNLADRPALREDLAAAPAHDVLLTELKAAGVDVVVRAARERGIEAAFCDHRPALVASPTGSGGADLASDLDTALDAVLDTAIARQRDRS